MTKSISYSFVGEEGFEYELSSIWMEKLNMYGMCSLSIKDEKEEIAFWDSEEFLVENLLPYLKGNKTSLRGIHWEKDSFKAYDLDEKDKSELARMIELGIEDGFFEFLNIKNAKKKDSSKEESKT